MYWIRVAVVTLFQDMKWSVRGGRSRTIVMIGETIDVISFMVHRKVVNQDGQSKILKCEG